MAAGPGAPPIATGRASAIAAATLVVAVAISAAVVWAGPQAASALVGSGGMSDAGVETVFTLVIFVPMIVIAVVVGALCRVNALAPGRYPLAKLVIGALVGLAGVVLTVVYASTASSLTEGAAPRAPALLLLWGLAVVAVQTGAEEIYFRGWVQPVVERAWGAIPAILLTSIAFAGLHVLGGARSPLTLINLFLGGLMFGILAWYGRGIAGAFAAHFAWNGAEQLILGLDPNPGVGSFGAILDLELAGAQAWGGSEEGLNASIAMTVILVLIVAALAGGLAWKRRAYARPKKLMID